MNMPTDAAKLLKQGRTSSRNAKVENAQNNLADKKITAINAAAERIDEMDPELVAESLMNLDESAVQGLDQQGHTVAIEHARNDNRII